DSFRASSLRSSTARSGREASNRHGNEDSDHVRAEEDGRVCFTVVAVSAELAEKRRQRRQALLEEFNEAREAAERIAASRRSPGFIKTNILDALCLTLPKNIY
ncbi:unnamed protein product, partial [Polarella glacialis]